MLIRPGGATSWKDGNAVIVEKETGTRYIFRDGQLHPVINYASALLALGTSARTLQVSRNSLTGTPRGTQIGIASADVIAVVTPLTRVTGMSSPSRSSASTSTTTRSAR